MDLEKLNKEYLKLKSKLETINKEAEKLEERANHLAQDKKIQEAEAIKAERNGDKDAQDAAKSKIKKIDDELKKIKEAVTKQKEAAKNLQGKIDKYIEEIKADPAMQAHLNEVLEKQYDRKLVILKDEYEKSKDKEERFIQLQQLVKDHPALANNLRGILSATLELQKLDKELEGLKDENGQYKDTASEQRGIEIETILKPAAEDKMQKNKVPLMEFINKKQLNITEQDIDELKNNIHVKGNKEGEVDLDTTMIANLGIIRRQNRGYEKTIRNHEIARERAKGVKTVIKDNGNIENQNTQKLPIIDKDGNPINNNPKDAIKQAIEKDRNKVKALLDREAIKDDVYKKHRIRAFFAERKWPFISEKARKYLDKAVQGKISDNKNKTIEILEGIKAAEDKIKHYDETNKTEVDKQKSTFKTEVDKQKSTFRDSLKYDIVRDIAKEEHTSNLHEASIERRDEDAQKKALGQLQPDNGDIHEGEIELD